MKAQTTNGPRRAAPGCIRMRLDAQSMIVSEATFIEVRTSLGWCTGGGAPSGDTHRPSHARTAGCYGSARDRWQFPDRSSCRRSVMRPLCERGHPEDGNELLPQASRSSKSVGDCRACHAAPMPDGDFDRLTCGGEPAD